MKILLSEAFSISDIGEHDAAAYVQHLQERQIADQTLHIPFPYTQEDAEWWIHHVHEEAKEQGQSLNWAIRNADRFLIGSIGLHDCQLGKSHKAELGYWIAKPHWGQGIATKAVRAVCQYATQQLGLVRITAHVFDFNLASSRVLEKAGFQLEGTLRKHYEKNGRIFDGKLYSYVV